MSDIIASLALLVSLASAGFSWWSAKEAAHTRKITRSQELAPHFINVGYLWSYVQDQGGLGREEIAAANKSINFLKAQLSFDHEFQNCIKDLSTWVENTPRVLMMILGDQEISPPVMSNEDNIPQQDVAAAKAVFDRKQHEYISIG